MIELPMLCDIDGATHRVYDVRYSNGYAHFLTYFEGKDGRKGTWRLVPAKHFTPYFSKDEQTGLTYR